MTLEAVRAVAVLVALLGLALAGRRWRELGAGMRRFFETPSHAINLGVLRVVVFGLLLVEASRDGDAHWFSQLPAALRVAPPGLGWALPHIPLDPTLVLVAQSAFVVLCVLAMLGCFTRLVAPAAVALGVYVLGVPQLFGKLNHYHHLLWLGAVLGASRCGDALSLDQIRILARSKTGRWRAALVGDSAPSTEYGLPLRICWVLIGLLYFFPGLWKLWAAGDAWLLGDNVRFLLHEKWYELGDFSPPIEIDRMPMAYRMLGLGTILFELGFLFLLFGTRTRRLAVLSGLAFHAGTFLFMGIHFLHLVLCYVSFADFGALARGSHREGATGRGAAAFPRPVAAVGVILIAAAIVCGIRGIDSWPFAVYPRFHYRSGPTIAYAVVGAVSADGSVRDLEPPPGLVQRMHSSRWLALLRRVARARGPEQEALLGGVVALLRREGAFRVTDRGVVIDRVVLWTDPARRSSNPVRRQRLAAWPLDAAGR